MAVIKSGASADLLTVDAASKAARATLYDAAGNPIGSVLGQDGQYQKCMTMTQNVFVSTLNSTMGYSQAAGTTWNGAIESTLGVAGIQVSSFITKKHTVTVWQSMDGANWDIYNSVSRPGNFGGSRTYQAVASYYYVSVKNEDAAALATGRVQTCLCPTVEALPRSLSQGGSLLVTPQAEWQGTKRTLGIYTVSSWATLGAAAVPQNLFTLENPAASTVNLAIRSLNITSDSTAAIATISPQIKLSRATAVSAGTVLVPVAYQTSFPAKNAIARGGNASDGGIATAITATAGTTIWAQWMDRMYTGVAQHQHMPYNMIPDVGADLRQLIVAPGEAILVQAVNNAIPSTTQLVVQCGWTESWVV